MAEDRKAVLVLKDGTYYEGKGFGASAKTEGEVVFNTVTLGYAECMTDPSYKGQILTFSYPLIGNIGVPSPNERDEYGISKFFESDYTHITPGTPISSYTDYAVPQLIKTRGIVVHEACKIPSHVSCAMTLDQWLKREGIPGIEGIDTRALIQKLREEGAMQGILQVFNEGEEPSLEKLQKEAAKIEDPDTQNLVNQVSIKEPIQYNHKDNLFKVVVIDLGTKFNILRSLLSRQVSVVRVPYNFSAKEILEYKPNGILISNGPGNPKHESLKSTIETIRQLVDAGVPLMGVCSGNLIFALAMGADTFKLKFGHRSANQPSMDLETNRCYVTFQNHGYAIVADSLQQTDLKLWYMNVNDRTVEGVKHTKAKAYSVQFHPEHLPGPIDAKHLFDQFIEMMKS